MKTTTPDRPKAKAKLRPEPVVPYADNPRFLKLYCAALTGLLSHPFSYLDPERGTVVLDSKGQLERIKWSVRQAWNAAVFSMQEFDIDTFNANVNHE